MSHEAIAEFADTMLTRFPPFKQWEDYQEKAWADDLVAELSGFSAEVIKRAQREIIRHRKPRDPRPPMVSECIAACLDARRLLEAQENQGRLPAMRQSQGGEWSDERKRLASDLINSSMGRQAAQDNPCWIKCLRDFCLKHQRLPENQREIDQLKREAREFEEAYRQAMTLKDGPLLVPVKQVLIRHGDLALAKREQLCAEVLGR